MEVDKVFEILQKIKTDHPALTNDEVLKLMILKTLLDIKVVLSK